MAHAAWVTRVCELRAPTPSDEGVSRPRLLDRPRARLDPPSTGHPPTSALLNKANADREREGAENHPSDDPLSARPRLSFPRPIAPAHRARGVTVQPVTQRRRARAWARDSNRTRAPVKAAIALPFCHQYLRSSDMLPPRLPAPRRRTPRRPEREGWVTLPKERRRSSPRGRPLPPSTRSRQRVSPVPTSWPQRLPHVCLVRHTPSESNGPLGQPTHPARPHYPHRSPATVTPRMSPDAPVFPSRSRPQEDPHRAHRGRAQPPGNEAPPLTSKNFVVVAKTKTKNHGIPPAPSVTLHIRTRESRRLEP